MDRLAAALGIDPVELRIVNAIATGDRLPTGQVVDGPAPVRELLEELRGMPLPPLARSTPMDLRELPGGVSNVTHGEGITRGVGFAVGFKNIAFAEGFDDYSTARVRLVPTEDGPVAEVHTAAAEVGQGLVTVIEQIVRTELDVERVVVLPSDTSVGSAGSTSASRQTWITGGAVQLACRRILERAGRGARSARSRSRRPPSTATARRSRSTPRPVRATRSWPSASPPTGPSATSTWSWASCAPSRSRPRRTSAGS